eukprot:7161434-Prymnesium_polylepis.1
MRLAAARTCARAHRGALSLPGRSAGEGRGIRQGLACIALPPSHCVFVLDSRARGSGRTRADEARGVRACSRGMRALARARCRRAMQNNERVCVAAHKTHWCGRASACNHTRAR